MLPVGSEVMLQRVVRLLSTQVGPIVVVAAAEQELPDLSENWLNANRPLASGPVTGSSVRIVRDPVEYRGPLAGLAVGLSHLRGEVDMVYVSACDVPLLQPAFIRAMIEALADAEIAVPFDGCYHHPLAAAYRVSVLPVIEELLAADQLRLSSLLEQCRTREVPVEQLRQVDPQLDSLHNTNTPEEYQQALHRLASGDLAMSLRPLPPYTHIPGVTPHPLRDPAGHSYEATHSSPGHSSPTVHASLTWDELLDHPEFRWAVRLFNHGYYWESHEAWESLWHGAGRCGGQADFLKGLIKLAAAGVKLGEQNLIGVERHSRRALELFWELYHQRASMNDISAAVPLSELMQIADQLRQHPPRPPEDCTGTPRPSLGRLP